MKRSPSWKYNPHEPLTSSPNLTRYLTEHTITGQRGIITFFHFLSENEKRKLLDSIQHVGKALHLYDDCLNVAKILDYGEEKGQLYFVEERIEGVSLRAACVRHGPLPLAEVLSLGRQMMRVFQFMHRAAICHSGISSTHIIKKQQSSREARTPVGPAQESAFFLTGWNFDRRIDEPSTLVEYPDSHAEVCAGDRPGEDSDHFALVVVLYEALTGKLPLKQEKDDDLHARHQAHVDAVPQPLQRVFDKAWSQQPGNQYKTIQEFFIDFEKACGEVDLRLLPPVMSAPSPSEQARLQPSGGGISRRTAIRAGISLAGLALAAWVFSEVEQATASSHHGSVHTRGTSQQLGDLLLLFDQHNATVNAAIPSPDGSKIVSVDMSSRLILWSALKGRRYWEDPLQHQRRSITDAAWDSTSRYFVTGDTSGGVVLWGVQQKAISKYYSLPASSQAVAWPWTSAPDSSGGHVLAVGGNQVYIFDDPVRQKLGLTDLPYNRQKGLINALATAPDGISAVSVASDGTAQVWTIETGAKQYDISDVSLGELSSVAYSPDGRYIAIGSVGGSLWLWDVARKKLTISYNHDGAVRSIAWSLDSHSLASGGDDNRVLLSNIDEYGHCIPYFTYPGHTENVLSVAWRDNESVVSAAGNEIRIWRARLQPSIE